MLLSVGYEVQLESNAAFLVDNQPDNIPTPPLHRVAYVLKNDDALFYLVLRIQRMAKMKFTKTEGCANRNHVNYFRSQRSP